MFRLGTYSVAQYQALKVEMTGVMNDLHAIEDRVSSILENSSRDEEYYEDMQVAMADVDRGIEEIERLFRRLFGEPKC